jgi:hypothetical protein
MSEQWFRERTRAIADPAPSAMLPLSGIMARGAALRRRRRRRTTVATVAAAAALLTSGGLIAGWPAVTGGRADVASGPQSLSPVVRERLAERVRDALEGDASGALRSGSTSLACAVRVLGTDPENISEVGDARTVYVWARCATVGTQVRTERSLPAAVRLTTPPTAEVPRDGALHRPDVRRIFPERLWKALEERQEYGNELESQVYQRIRDKS